METDHTQVIERMNQIFEEIERNPISDIIDINNSILHMVHQNVDYVKTSSKYSSTPNNRIIAFKEFDVSYGIQMDIDCDVTFYVGSTKTFQLHCPKDLFVLFPIPICDVTLLYRNNVYHIFPKNNISFYNMEIYGIRLDSRIRSFLAQNYFVIDRFYFIHGELVDIVYDHVYSKYDVYCQYQYLPDHFDYSKNTQIDKSGKKWFCLQSFGILKREMKRVIERNAVIQEELVEKIWNPLRIQGIADQYDIPFTNLIDIYA